MTGLKERVLTHQRSGFNNSFKTVDITDEERQIGEETNDYFEGKIIRGLPWEIKKGRIKIHPAYAKIIPGLQSDIITAEALRKEEISEPLARMTGILKNVEDGLTYYGAEALVTTRNIMGLNRGYFQWIRDESQHPPALGMILEHTGHRTARQTVDDYYANVRHSWEHPFPTVRQMVAYVCLQERNTGENYKRFADAADREGAHTVATIYRLIGHYEAFHCGSFIGNMRIFYKHDAEGTKSDLLYVAANFFMPRQNLYDNPLQVLKDSKRLGLYDRDLVSEDTIHHTLKAVGFVSEEEAQRAAKNYWEKPGVVELQTVSE